MIVNKQENYYYKKKKEIQKNYEKITEIVMML